MIEEGSGSTRYKTVMGDEAEQEAPPLAEEEAPEEEAAVPVEVGEEGAGGEEGGGDAAEAAEAPPAAVGEGVAGAGGTGEEEVNTEGISDQEKAALKIQTIARGSADRKKVADLKEKGELPGQMRTASAEAAEAAPGEGEAEGAGEEVNTDGMSEEDRAAVKIQTIQRGKRDRSKVEEAKQKGDLPGQNRANAEEAKAKQASEPAPVTAARAAPRMVALDESVGEILFYDGIGSSYNGELVNGRPHGKGMYTFANGNIYDGTFANGQFEGEGELRFPGYGRFVAKFENGRAIGGKFLFEDGLEYQPQGWKYCVEGDRRFYHEVVDPRFGLADE